MNYKETTDYIFTLLPSYQRDGQKGIKKDLINILKLCEILGNPHKSLRCIHVGGTNGKGSVSHLISAGLQSKGFKVGIYTSPHYMDFKERIKINGTFISEDEVVKFVSKIKKEIEHIRPSFFEVTVAMAFDHFRNENVDYAVIEVGLGGRLDSTNIITPILSVITNIGFDHMDYLGDTKPKIAAEKAGIIKDKKPVIIGESDVETDSVFRNKSEECQSEIHFADKQWILEKADSKTSFKLIDKNSNNQVYTFIHKGPFHVTNTRTAISALKNIYPNFTSDELESAINDFEKSTSFFGRWQLISRGPDVVLDSGHNSHALKKSLKHIKNTDYNSVHFILGFSKDKDVKSMVNLLPKNGIYYLSKAQMSRGAETSSFVKYFEDRNLNYRSYITLSSALKAAKRSGEKEDLIFIGGSSFVVGELLKEKKD